jgi:hypothetical protein
MTGGQIATFARSPSFPALFAKESRMELAVCTVLIIGVHRANELFGPRVDLARLNHTLNLFYSLASLLGLLVSTWILAHHSSLFSSLDNLLCSELPASLDTVQRVYFYSKLWEGLLDLNIVTARGFPIIAHFRWHHYTTPCFAYLGVLTRSSHSALFMLLNLTMHALVYFFLSGRRYDSLKRVIRMWQYVQLLGGVALCIASLYFRVAGNPCTRADWIGVLGDTLPALLFLLYLHLFQLELELEKQQELKSQ